MVSMSGSVACERDLTEHFVDVYGVSADLAYAVYGTQVLKYSAGSWAPLASLPAEGSAIWADANSVAVVGPTQTAFLKMGAADFAALQSVPAGDYSAVWGTGASDLWMTNSAQLVHFDGTGWQAFPTPEFAGEGIWGDGKNVYYRGGGLGRWNGQAAETLIPGPATSSGPAVWGLWGRSASEIFIGLHEPAFDQYACGGEFILWFDGMAYHRF
jgi:hypothetical protein